ncbi:MAG: ABC-F family ATP-binding cassette domain-containing protein [Polyangiaceae bacterium]|nr:ABC-F family ATP-binding cassette domain-containing protein [Polyangiaceae bacterium]
MALLEVADLAFGYSERPLFQGVTFRLEPGERASLVAPNGAGKSTLLRVLAGELRADQGTVVVRRETTLGYYRQSHELSREGTVRDALLSGFGELVALRHDLASAQEAAASGSERDLARLADAMDRYHLAGADALERRVETIATRLGFRVSDMDREVASLSGGERGRIQLGSVLATEPELLLLDEPTNHLDLDTIRWLEGHLAAWRGAVLVVSHDRAFLDAACPSTLELGREGFRVYGVPFSAYETEREADLARERDQAEQQAAFVAKTEDFIRRNLAGQKTKQAQSRRRMLEKLDRVDRPEDVWARAEKVRFSFAPAPRSGDIVLEARGLGAERGGQRLFAGFDLLVRRGDRVGIVGRNGCGKSTLLRLLAGQGGSEDEGEVRRGTNLRDGYFDQQLGTLDPEKTGVDEIRSVRGDLNVEATRNYLGRFRFSGDDPLRKVASLSGGERTRLALAKLLLEPRNLLFLDEPTNHLDIPAAKILEEALSGFEGTVLLVSHDRRFLEGVTTRTISYGEGGAIDLYEGGFCDYTEMLARRERAAAEEQAERGRARAAAEARAAAGARAGADRHRRDREARRELEKKQRRASTLERDIGAEEARLAELRQRLCDAGGGDWEKLHEWAREERSLAAKVDAMTKEWVALSEELEAAGPPPAQEATS